MRFTAHLIDDKSVIRDLAQIILCDESSVDLLHFMHTDLLLNGIESESSALFVECYKPTTHFWLPISLLVKSIRKRNPFLFNKEISPLALSV